MALKTTDKQLGGATGHGFLPGRSGNPGGRPKGFAGLIRAHVGADGERLVEATILLAYGTPAQRRT